MMVVTLLRLILALGELPASPKLGKLADFIVPGHVILDTASGDMNGDKLADVVLVLRSVDEDLKDYESRLRPTLILFGQSGETFRLIAGNDDIVLDQYDGGVWGDHWEGIAISKSNFSLQFYGGSAWRWSHVITFKHDKKRNDFFLLHDRSVTYHVSDPNKTDNHIYNRLLYGKLRFSNYQHWENQLSHTYQMYSEISMLVIVGHHSRVVTHVS